MSLCLELEHRLGLIQPRKNSLMLTKCQLYLSLLSQTKPLNYLHEVLAYGRLKNLFPKELADCFSSKNSIQIQEIRWDWKVRAQNKLNKILLCLYWSNLVMIKKLRNKIIMKKDLVMKSQQNIKSFKFFLVKFMKTLLWVKTIKDNNTYLRWIKYENFKIFLKKLNLLIDYWFWKFF